MHAGEKILTSLKRVRGIEEVFLLEEAERFGLFDIEVAAEKKAFMGMGKTYNSGIREVLVCPLRIVCITTVDFEWGCQSHMLLKKDDRIVGEEVWDLNQIRELEKRPDVHFLHRNFVIYTAKVNFPQDVVQKRCYFEYPAIPPGKDVAAALPADAECLLCYPSTAGDIFLKKALYDGRDERGTGTVVLGFKDGH
ncbi:MAG: hypothetical protein DRI57_24340 [Deltaproteobacteria bacterium]|nr:MAG: hypothetical protein DRI57_24340 [Deltaproteobacteria bacterium]